MAVNAADVKKLRDKTGAGMLDCKKALEKADGDFDAAERILKEMGLAAVAKRSSRIAEEGRIFAYVGKDSAGIMELSCETDFVARNAEFAARGSEVLKDAVEGKKKADDASLLSQVNELATTIKENLQIRRLDTVSIGSDELVVEYVHGEEGRVGVLVKLKTSAGLAGNAKVQDLGRDLALHAAAFNPPYLDESAVPAQYISEQEAIFTAQAEGMDKPAQVIQGIVKGKLGKHLKEICFASQPFVKDEKRSVSKVCEDLGKELGGSITLADYRVFRAGEEL